MDGIRGISGIEGPSGPGATTPAARPGGQSFASALGEAIAKVDQLQLAGDAEAGKLAEGAGNLHETALALEKADVAMKLALKVRNKIVDAYQDVMRMSV